ncbi:MAG: hypothetical protein HYX75_18440 [Acidobacteria bacterium]|nr:hypothetical protein [Acidobacteriota bacterium]
MSLWSVDARDVINHTRSPGGDKFTKFVDSLIRSQAFAGGLPDAFVHTNIQTNQPDGGVDTLVKAPIPNDPTGRFGVPSVWQYKARAAVDVRKAQLLRELQNPFVKSNLLQGGAYRLCVCDSIAAPKKANWEALLRIEARKLNPAAPDPLVVSADDLAAWASRFPSLVVEFFRPELAGAALPLRIRAKSVIGNTPLYIDVQARMEVETAIMNHIAFSVSCKHSILVLRGASGSGKRRFLCECLSKIPGADGTVLYVDSEDVGRVARTLLVDQSVTAILVVDDCDTETRVAAAQLIQGHEHRIRAILVDSASRQACPDDAIWIDPLPSQVITDILDRNFPGVPAERRLAYLKLAGDNIRFAADMCANDRQTTVASGKGAVPSSVPDYLAVRLTQQESKVAEALSLQMKVAFKGPAQEEIVLLSYWVGMDKDELIEMANRLESNGGVVRKVGRYFRVAPAVAARALLASAWKTRAEYDPAAFLMRIPPRLLPSFLDRVQRDASPEVRGSVSSYFLQWATTLQPQSLADTATTDRIIALARIDPKPYLSILRNLVHKASREGTLNLLSQAENGRNPRRKLVWLLQDLGHLQEMFDEVESVLLELAVEETEPNIANNARRIWTELFRIHLSGTPTPFRRRMEPLKVRLLSERREVVSLALDALDGIFEELAVGHPSPTLVAGTIPPPDWRPSTLSEERECLEQAVQLLRELSHGEDSLLVTGSHRIVISRLRHLLRAGYLDDVVAMFEARNISDELRASLLEVGEEFVQYDVDRDSEKPEQAEAYVLQVRQWIDSLIPRDLHGRLRVLVGKASHRDSTSAGEESWLAEIRALATKYQQSPTSLLNDVEWLFSDQARSAETFGRELGELDEDARFLDVVLEATRHHSRIEFAKGYVMGLMDSRPHLTGRLSAGLDEMEVVAPRAAFDLSIGIGDAASPVSRALRLYDKGLLTPIHLGNLLRGWIGHSIGDREFRELFGRLVDAATKGKDELARQLALESLTARIEQKKRSGEAPVVAHRQTRILIWKLIEAGGFVTAEECLHWLVVLKELMGAEPTRTIRAAVKGLFEGEYALSDDAEKVSVVLARANPDEVMREVGRLLLSSRHGRRLDITHGRSLFSAIPHENTMNWLRSNGRRGAQKIARFLPAPRSTPDGQMFVPPLTEFVLTEFEDDESVFDEFCAGSWYVGGLAGDIAGRYREAEESAKRFLSHPLRRVREWALRATHDARESAERWRLYQEEIDLE